MEREEIFRLTVEGLKKKLGELGCSTTGRKATLQDRLCEHYGLLVRDDNGSDSGDGDSAHSCISAVPQAVLGRSNFTLRDIADSLTSFSGNGHQAVDEWLDEFESNATAVGWDGLQKYIYAKQLLKGAAKMFIRSQRSVVSWDMLKQALRQEFGVNISSIDVHRALRNRRKRPNEDFREYLYCLMEIGAPIRLDEKV